MRLLRHGLPRFSILLFLAGALLPAQDAGEWIWPSDRVGSLAPAGARWFRVALPTGPDARARAIAPGQVIYRDRRVATRPTRIGPRAVPRAQPRAVVQHGNEIVSMYRAPGLSVRAGARPTFRVAASGVAAIEFTIVDGLSLSAVQPRALLPENAGLPDSGMPVLGFFQNGQLVLSRNLAAGPYELTVPARWLEAAALPRSMTILRDGLLVSELALVDPEVVAARIDERGNLVLHRGELDPGSGIFDVEIRRYDGGVEQQTIPVRIPEPPTALDNR